MKISAIIPAYNSENTITRCITSIMNQSYNDFEVIVINDGSTDSTLNILQKLIRDDDRFILINQNNKGVSEARNEGLQIVSGDFITFIDSDDVILVNYFSDLIADYQSRSNLDMVWQEVTKIYKDEENGSPKKKLNYINAKDFKVLFKEKKISLRGNPVAKLFRTAVVKHHNLKFIPSLTYNEDKIFVLEYIYNCEGDILFSNTSNYNYYIHKNSLSHSLLLPDEYWKPYQYFKRLIEEKFQLDHNKADFSILYENFKIYLHMYINAIFLHERGNEKEYIDRFNSDDWNIYKNISVNRSSLIRQIFDFFFFRRQYTILRLFSRIYLKRMFK